MTNAEIYIGDEDLIDQFIDEFNKFACKQDWDLEYHCLKERLVEFFKQERTPALTEDEKVILRNIAKHSDFEKIGRAKIGGLYVTCRINIPTEEKWAISFFEHLFQFIKERRRIHY